MVGGALTPIGMGGVGVGDGEEQSISAHVIKPIFVIALQTYIPLSLTFTEEKGEIPS